MTSDRNAPRRLRSMPKKHPRIAHFMPYAWGDSLAAIVTAARLLFRYIDQNAHVDADSEVWILHWGDMRDFRWEWTGAYVGHGKRRREVRRRVPKRPIGGMPTSKVARRRRRAVGGRRPRRAIAHMRRAESAGIVWCMEAKGSRGFLRRQVWEHLAAQATETGVRMVVMTLTNLHRKGHPSDPYDRLLLASAVGFQVAVLPRTKRPAKWHEYKKAGIAVWGRWRK